MQGLVPILVHFGAIAVVTVIGATVHGALLARFGTLRLIPPRKDAHR